MRYAFCLSISSSHYARVGLRVLTGVNYDDLAIATRHNLLQKMVNHDEPYLMSREKHPYLEVGRVTHYHPPCSRLFEYRVDLSTNFFLAV